VLLAEHEDHRVSPSLLGSSSLRRFSTNRSGTPAAMMSAYSKHNSRPIAAMMSGPSVGAGLFSLLSLIERFCRVGLRTWTAHIAGSPLVDCLTAQIQDTTMRKSTGQPSNVWNQTINARNEENGGACLDALSRAIMDYDALNTGVRKFFRKVRVTAQREIEKAVRAADAKLAALPKSAGAGHNLS
jgi:hypothetical protein